MENFRERRLLLRLGILVAAVVVGLITAEVILSLLWNNPFRNQDASMLVLLRANHSNAHLVFDRSPINRTDPEIRYRTDERGYILPSIRFENPDYTVAFLGGSTTECMYVREEFRFPAHTSALLEEVGYDVNTLNFGRSGNDIHHSINNLLNHVIEDRPDVVVLMHAWNDIGHLTQMGSYQLAMGNRPTMGALGRLFVQKSSPRLNLVSLVRHTIDLQTVKRRLVDGTESSSAGAVELPETAISQFKDRLRAFVYLSRAFGITPVLMTQPSSSQRNELTPEWIDRPVQKHFTKAVREVAAEENAELIDLIQFLLDKESELGKFPEPVFYDGVHLTDYGSVLYAEHIAKRLAEIFNR